MFLGSTTTPTGGLPPIKTDLVISGYRVKYLNVAFKTSLADGRAQLLRDFVSIVIVSQSDVLQRVKIYVAGVQTHNDMINFASLITKKAYVSYVDWDYVGLTVTDSLETYYESLPQQGNVYIDEATFAVKYKIGEEITIRLTTADSSHPLGTAQLKILEQRLDNKDWEAVDIITNKIWVLHPNVALWSATNRVLVINVPPITTEPVVSDNPIVPTPSLPSPTPSLPSPTPSLPSTALPQLPPKYENLSYQIPENPNSTAAGISLESLKDSFIAANYDARISVDKSNKKTLYVVYTTSAELANIQKAYADYNNASSTGNTNNTQAGMSSSTLYMLIGGAVLAVLLLRR